MSLWILPAVPPQKLAEHRKAERRIYHQRWREENREHLNRYWRRHYAANRPRRRRYLNVKQNEYRAAAAKRRSA